MFFSRSNFIKKCPWILLAFALIFLQFYFTTSFFHFKRIYRNQSKHDEAGDFNSNAAEELTQLMRPLTLEEVSNGSVNISQDDPRLLKYIREHHLTPPPSPKGLLTRAVYKNPHDPDKQFEQLEVYHYVHNLLNNMSGGFFVDCGANDGTYYSNTLPLELDFGWKGLLIEADPGPFKALRELKRNAWLADVCLSPQPFPIKMSYMVNSWASSISHLNIPEYNLSLAGGSTFNEVKIQCMPLYSILKAINVTQVDFFSLDVENAELSILKTIPWNSVYIKVLGIEAIPLYQKAVKDFMTSVGYKYLTFIHNSFSVDQIYIHPNASQSN